MYDVLIFGGGVSSISCALVLGSARNKPFVADKKIAVISHQKNSNLQEAIINNAYGIPAGKMGSEILVDSIEHLSSTYPHIIQIPNEKVLKIEGEFENLTIITNKKTYKSKIIVVGIGAANTFAIEGLMQYVEPNQKTPIEKRRIQLRNIDHKIVDGIYVIGTLAGLRSQLCIAAGSGASTATDILTIWNDGIPTQSHDSIKK